jgi:hypothetical protein
MESLGFLSLPENTFCAEREEGGRKFEEKKLVN